MNFKKQQHMEYKFIDYGTKHFLLLLVLNKVSVRLMKFRNNGEDTSSLEVQILVDLWTIYIELKKF